MNKIIIAVLFVILLPKIIEAKVNYSEKDEVNRLIEELYLQERRINEIYFPLKLRIQNELRQLSNQLKRSSTPDEQLKILVKKDQLRNIFQSLIFNQQNELIRVRYLKGLEVIKILYEKIIALDHHFSSMITFNEMNSISNPNNYREFGEIKELLKSSNKRKMGFELGDILNDNIYTSILHTFISLFTSTESSKTKKEQNLKKIECILDFSLKMHSDLNTIYFESSFLKKSNDNTLEKLNNLFLDYIKPIKYKLTLSQCRNTDDWDEIKVKLDDYFTLVDHKNTNSMDIYGAHKMKIDLEFPIDQLLQFINYYNSFVDQGSKFYEKFAIMLDSYDPPSNCVSSIPVQFKSLQDNISISIQKFNAAYKPVEVNGSKLKEVLYGVSAFD
ncbi:MAG: hypothetical protein KJN68_02530 [Bacteroidia bacterium]|nr:hypothetical protein [Bacteroidia bacterium]